MPTMSSSLQKLQLKKNELVYFKKDFVVGIGPFVRGIFTKTKELEPVIIYSNRIIPVVNGAKSKSVLYYFEVKINNIGNGEIYIGLANKHHSMHNILGQEDSYAYKVTGSFHRSSGAIPYGLKAENGSIIGCGWDQRTGFLFYTYNGDFLSVAAFKVVGEYHAVVGINGYDIEVKINLGHEDYVYDCRNWLKVNHLMTKFEDSLYKQLCTFSANGYLYIPQQVYHCNTCNFVDNYGVCEVCVKKCHEGHDISGPTLSYGFFCDCGEQTFTKTKSCCNALPENIEQLVEKRNKLF